ncbi:MAG: phosphoribosylglycinamide formyltransferase [Candidatus Marinimicrobia bacterium]|nr:phosphoribosylglycinamide formyltransferase [Candidatus Neomarinimicrobiota bacterium]
MKNIAVFASGRGSNYKTIQDQIKAGNIPGQVVCVISDKPTPPVFEKAEDNDIPTYYIAGKQFKEEQQYTDFLLNILDKYDTELILLAGYLKLIPSRIVERYRHAIINIHPALLPKYGGKGYYGLKVHEAVLKAGDEKSGATVHFVDEIYDNGLIIKQEEVEVKPDDTPHDLADRVLKVEHKIFPEVVKAFCEDRISITKDGVIIKDE